MTRRFLRSICRALMGIVLVAQLAVSAYACPGLPSTGDATMQMSAPAVIVAQTTDVAMSATDRPASDCADMAGPVDRSFANLCAEHCHQGQQSDHAATLTVPAALFTALYTTPVAPEPSVAPRPAADATSALVAASPPLAILHCCFRI